MKKEEVEKIILDEDVCTCEGYKGLAKILAEKITSQITIDEEEVVKIINKTMRYYGDPNLPTGYKVVLIKTALKKANPIKIEEKK